MLLYNLVERTLDLYFSSYPTSLYQNIQTSLLLYKLTSLALQRVRRWISEN